MRAVNLNLGPDPAKAVKVSVLERLATGAYVGPTPGSIDDVGPGSMVVPVLQTKGGVWIKHKVRAPALRPRARKPQPTRVSPQAKKLSEHSFGLIWECASLLVVKRADGAGAGAFNLDGVALQPAAAAAADEAADEAGGGAAGDAPGLAAQSQFDD